MKILFLTPRDSRKHVGGVETHVRVLTEELEKQGHEVGELSLSDAMESCKGSTLHPQGRTFGDKLQAWKYLWQKRDLFKWADIIHIHDVFWWYLPFRFLIPTKPIFTTFHGWEGECPPSRSAIIQKRIAMKLSRGTIGIGNFFEKWYGVRPDKVSWGAHDDKWTNRQKDKWTNRQIKKIRISFYGRIDSVNGIDVALEAFRILKGPAFRAKGRALRNEFLFIGDGPARKDAENIGRVTGMVKNPWTFLQQSDLVITSSYLCMLEAAALKHPIIAVSTNPLKNDYLTSHPLSQYITICHASKEIVDRIVLYQKSKKQKAMSNKDIKKAYRWAVSQTPLKLADMYDDLWNR